MIKFNIIGTGGLSEQLTQLIEKGEVKNITKINNIYKLDNHNLKSFHKYKIKTFNPNLINKKKNELNIVAISNPFYRKKILSQINKNKLTNFFHNTVKIYDNSKIGKGNIFLPNVFVNLKVKIKDGNLFFHNSLISHHCIIKSFNNLSVNSVILGHTLIENCIEIGSNTTIGMKIKVGSDSIVKSNYFLKKSVKRRTFIIE